jgi:small-conductance mechanosensitive channel
LFTVVEQYDGVIFYVPNVKFLQDVVKCYTANTKRRVEVEV